MLLAHVLRQFTQVFPEVLRYFHHSLTVWPKNRIHVDRIHELLSKSSVCFSLNFKANHVSKYLESTVKYTFCPIKQP